MIRERVSEDIYVFTSDLYVQVTAGVIATPDGAIVVDTLPFPVESRQLKQFASRLSKNGIRYVINTTSHADHSYGSYLFSESELIAHRRCRELQAKLGERALAEAKMSTPELADVQLRLPTMLADREMTIRLGGKTIVIDHSPGSAPDVITVHIKEDKVMFASDTVMPVPYIVGGNPSELATSIKAVMALPLENIVQGHGEVLLRGEIQETLESSLAYLQCIQEVVDHTIARGLPRASLRDNDIESCGKSRIPLGGLVQQLHRGNLFYLYDQRMAERHAGRDGQLRGMSQPQITEGTGGGSV